MARRAAGASRTRHFGAALFIGIAAGALFLLLAQTLRPALVFEMDRGLPKSAAGFYPVEISGDEAFVWTSGRAVLRLPGLDRRTPWSCVIRFRGVRPATLPQPRLTIALDGVQVAAGVATNDYQDLALTFQRRPGGTGATLNFSSAPVFVPGNGDSRELGVQVDRLSCAPRRAWVMAPLPAVLSMGASAGALAGAVALAGASLPASAAVAMAVALGQTALLTSNGAIYGPYHGKVLWFALGVGVFVLVLVRIVEWVGSVPLRPAALTAIAVSAIAFFLKTLGLLHPAKPAIDAVFQAHRLEWVLSGRYFFTQPMPDGVEFPYAIGLYVFAAPWTLLTHDFVSLLRIVVVAAEALAGGLLYFAIVRTWRDGSAGAWAVVLFHLTPLPNVVIGNANLTNAFGQAAALTALALAIAVPLRWRRFGPVGGLAALVSLAFLSHVSTLALLGVMLATLVFCLWAVGGRVLRPVAVALIVVTIAASGFSIGLYYRHFGEVYTRAMTRVSDAGRTTAVHTPEPVPGEARVGAERGLVDRLGLAFRETHRAIGWPLLLLAAAGAWTLRRTDLRSPIACAICAWLGVWALFTGLTVFARVGPEFERYAVEFLGRVNLAVYPAFILLAARGVSVTLANVPGLGAQASLAARGAVSALVVCALATGLRAWFHWFG